ncbi:pyridoxal-phosphate dependent enzyme [Paenibacillus nasutitermitis]|uniref:Threonine synthase n=1 Tax=Paenibacillus nasutitermitis TaxID=1652958 RepID=A0A916ZJ81_9BACL|nr:pyridoxal-phosphate dependent enzyme [Paenibacillus nasutitermitis]GGD99169.1 threonine synthase [Paenibacillus nasutitermitis]
MNDAQHITDQQSGENATGIWRFAKWLPAVPSNQRITLGEGNTPLVASRSLGKELGLSALHFKLEGANPTGSYKDRISALGVSLALTKGKVGCIGTSSGNAGASAAAYAARAGIPYYLYVLENILQAKMVQAALHKASITRIQGFGVSAEIGDRVFEWIEEQAKERNLETMITAYKYNANAMEAVKTISFELAQQLAFCPAPDAVFIPVGGGGLYAGISNGFRHLRQLGRIDSIPQLAAVQSAGCSNIVRAWTNGEAVPAPGDSTSMISGLQVPNPPDGERVLESLISKEGFGVSVSDSDVWYWQERLAAQEGIWCEPAAALSLAGVAEAVKDGRLKAGSSAVCILTGAGYKDGERAVAMAGVQENIPLVDINRLEN